MMKIIDLTMPISSGMDVYPGDPEVKIECIHTYEKNSWELRQIQMGSHTGTHVDAYSHMHKGKSTLDDISLERFFGKALLVEQLENSPKESGLFFIEEIGLEQFEQIRALQPTFVGGNLTEELERALLGQEIITYTGLVNLELLPKGKTFTFYGLPLKIKSGDGSPVRAIAIIDDENT